jgi:hypothetical protein
LHGVFVALAIDLGEKDTANPGLQREGFANRCERTLIARVRIIPADQRTIALRIEGGRKRSLGAAPVLGIKETGER